MKTLVFISLLSLYACCDNISSDLKNDSLLNSKWRLVKMDNTDMPAAEKAPTLIFSGKPGELGGNGGCNSFGGDIEFRGEKVSINNIFSTKMFCEETSGIEDKYFTALGHAERIILSDETLLIILEDQTALVFERMKNN